jgi:hypothetical protein
MRGESRSNIEALLAISLDLQMLVSKGMCSTDS